MNLKEGIEAAKKRGHDLAHDPPHTLVRMDRYTCRGCGAAVLGNGVTAYGSALERDCTHDRVRRPDDIDGMVRDIERRVSVRKLWRCMAGWGMAFVLTAAQARKHGCGGRTLAEASEAERIAKARREGWERSAKKSSVREKIAVLDAMPQTNEYERNGTVFAYYSSISECVRAEYAVWVLGKKRPVRRRAA